MTATRAIRDRDGRLDRFVPLSAEAPMRCPRHVPGHVTYFDLPPRATAHRVPLGLIAAGLALAIGATAFEIVRTHFPSLQPALALSLQLESPGRMPPASAGVSIAAGARP